MASLSFWGKRLIADGEENVKFAGEARITNCARFYDNRSLALGVGSRARNSSGENEINL